MKVFRALNIRGEKACLTAMVEDIRRSLMDGWTQAIADEERINSRRTDDNLAYCFSCSRKGDRLAATIFLVHKNENEIDVANILPKTYGALTYDEYNLILQDFYDKFLQQAAARNQVEAEITAGDKDLEQWVSSDTARLLRYFSDHANKRSGSANPRDRENWYAFLVSAHADKSELGSSTLARWLHEVGGWDEEQSNELAIEYQFAHGLLQYADAEKIEN